MYVDTKKQPIAEETLKNIFLINEETNQVYISIEDIAKLVGYEYYNGGYGTEETNKCYLDNKKEVAGFEGGTSQLYKADSISNIQSYDWYTLEEPVKAMGGKLYASSGSIEKACNLVFKYNTEKNRIEILTLPYLISVYEPIVINNFEFAGIDSEYKNQKALLQNMIVVKKVDGKTNDKKIIYKYGVISIDGKQILGPKYEKLEYIEIANDFYTTIDGKMGIMSHEGAQKIQPNYDEIKVIDNDLRLYYVKNGNMCGVLDKDGQRVVYLEYNKVGVDATLFPFNEIRNSMLLYDNCIPVMKNNKWGIFDIKGDLIVSNVYDNLGYIEGARKESATNNLLLIPEIQGIVVCRENKYGIVNSTGKTLVTPVCDKIYGSKNLGVNIYYVEYNGNTYELNQFLKTMVQNTGDMVEDNTQLNPIENVTGPTNPNVYVDTPVPTQNVQYTY